VYALPFPDASFDVVHAHQLLQHLSAPVRALSEMRRVLRPGGRLLVHTMPNRTVYDVTYRIQRAVRPDRWRRWPADPRNDEERALHVNEQTARGLHRALESAGFAATVRHGDWIHTAHVPDVRAGRLYERLAAHRWTRALGAADLWAEAVAR
jgi:ubiquinone/menaquinone biosynthesis C-methylase UbiE